MYAAIKLTIYLFEYIFAQRNKHFSDAMGTDGNTGDIFRAYFIILFYTLSSVWFNVFVIMVQSADQVQNINFKFELIEKNRSSDVENFDNFRAEFTYRIFFSIFVICLVVVLCKNKHSFFFLNYINFIFMR